MINQLPAAYRTELLFVAVVKRWLLGECPAADRLAYLEWLGSHDRPPITPDVVAAIAPASDATMVVVNEAVRLSADDNGAAMFRALEQPDVLTALTATFTNGHGRPDGANGYHHG